MSRAPHASRVIHVSREGLEAREAELLTRLGMTWEAFDEHERTHTLDGCEWGIWDEMTGIRFLLGRDRGPTAEG